MKVRGELEELPDTMLLGRGSLMHMEHMQTGGDGSSPAMSGQLAGPQHGCAGG